MEGCMLIRITCKHFCAAVVIENDRVARVAPILAYMKDWTAARVLQYAHQIRKWDVWIGP